MRTPAVASGIVTDLPPFPYPGLRPFETDEWRIFFGREPMIDEVIDRLALQRLVMIHGASGSGKSSLVRAGVLPKLARQHLRHGAAWLTCAMRPSGGPLWNLAAELARLEGRAGDIDRMGELIRLCNRRDATLGSVVVSMDALAGRHLCILVDQFEELFRFERETSREEAELFINLLIGDIPDPEAGEAPPPSTLHVIVTMRSEFLGECARFGGFAEAINRTQYLVPRLSRASLVRAIQQPARLYGGEVSAELCERLIAGVRGKLDELPLIQHGLMLFWHEAATQGASVRPALGADMLERAGGLAALLSQHADGVLLSVARTEPRTKAVERLFRALSDVNADGQGIRRPQTFANLVAVCGVPAAYLREIIDAFRADGVSFLTPYLPADITNETVIDISHEALIRCWNALSDPQTGWLRREFDDGLIWRSILLEAQAFERDERHTLSAQTTIERALWLKGQSEPWSRRHGGGWASVGAMMKESQRARIRNHRYRRLAILIIAVISLMLLSAAHEVAFPVANGSTFTKMTRGELVYSIAFTALLSWTVLYLVVTFVQILVGLIRISRVVRRNIMRGISLVRNSILVRRRGTGRSPDGRFDRGQNPVASNLFNLTASFVFRTVNRFRYRGYILPLCSICVQIITLGMAELIVDAARLPFGDFLDAALEASIVINSVWTVVSLSVAVWMFGARVLRRINTMFRRRSRSDAEAVTSSGVR